MKKQTLLQRDILAAMEREEARLLASGENPERLRFVQEAVYDLKDGLCQICISPSPNR